jgi:hypothetical protein
VQPLRIGLAQTRKSWGAQQEQHPLRLELSSEQSGPWGVVEDEPVWDEYSGARKRVRRRFKLESSVWQPRKESGNSKDYYETSAAMRNTFKYDWDLAVMAHGLEQFIANSQLQAEKIGSKASVLTAMAEVKEAEEAVWRHQQIIYGAFDHYALKEWSNRVDRDGEANVWGLVFNAFLEFCRDMRWEHPKCPASYFGIIFKQVNVEDRKTKDLDKYNHANLMSRHEFFQAIVRIAIRRYVATGEIPDVSDAIDRVGADMQTWLAPEAKQNSNNFRARYCYNAQVSDVLEKHLNSLRLLYQTFSTTNETVNSINSKQLLSIGEWQAFIKDLYLDTLGLSKLEEMYVFMWSRIRSVNDYSARSQVRLRHLLFEDFMEALVRLATMVALPTDADLQHTKCSHAGEYIMQLRGEGRSAIEMFLRQRQQKWNREPRQRIWRAVDHLINYLVYRVEMNAQGSVHDLEITAGEMSSYFAARKSGRKRISTVMSQLSNKNAFAESFQSVKEKLHALMRGINIFSTLEDRQIDSLLEHMSNAPFEKGESIFEQGDVGDSFYVILSGEAEVLRDDNPDDDVPETVLAKVGRFDFFGERALLKAEPRYACVRATSQLMTLALDQDDCVAALGRALKDIVPDVY